MSNTVDKKLLKTTKFPPEFDKKVDTTKIDSEVIKTWIASRISRILDDELVIDLSFNLLEENRFLDIKSMQIQLTGFLDKEAAPFCKELWNLCLSAQANENGIPEHLLRAKVEELRQKEMDAKNSAAQTRQRIDDTNSRQNRSQQSRFRDRGDRNNGFDNRRRSRSPIPNRRRQETDSYVPSDRRNNGPPRKRHATGVDQDPHLEVRSPPPHRRDRALSPGNDRARHRSASHSRRSSQKIREAREGRDRQKHHRRSPSPVDLDRSRSTRGRTQRSRDRSSDTSPSPHRRRRSPSSESGCDDHPRKRHRSLDRSNKVLKQFRSGNADADLK